MKTQSYAASTTSTELKKKKNPKLLLITLVVRMLDMTFFKYSKTDVLRQQYTGKNTIYII